MENPAEQDNRDETKKYDPENSESLTESRTYDSPVTSSPGKAPYVGSHSDDYDQHKPDRNVPKDGPSGENTENGGEQGGGLWTSGGTVVSGTPYHDEDDPKE